MSVIKERLTEFLTYKGIGQIKFAEAAGLSRSRELWGFLFGRTVI